VQVTVGGSPQQVGRQPTPSFLNTFSAVGSFVLSASTLPLIYTV
jgi:hypothetical protein